MTAPALAAGAYAAAAQKLGGAAALKPAAAAAAPETSFAGLLSQALGTVSQTGQAADTAAMNATAGRTDMIDIVTAVAESETAMQTLVSVRDRVISAYQEIMRMSI
ncbi:flagellar hook-basal body complex protein FliE [Labrys wisconsinensis]|uniref:Flagellar hook-basal body complex protein FliE n=1 Tax=Labrys wisconsinensis TaxID=425677 RepID=A0ABU0JCT9_9HYPH|nr:flagellar hook-basal body complex protein FliE [Labrys wisconsinensis]MDQ0471420.1 flagellar hook-basal body complex protein FliE [Labrys wisconsinensis]